MTRPTYRQEFTSLILCCSKNTGLLRPTRSTKALEAETHGSLCNPCQSLSKIVTLLLLISTSLIPRDNLAADRPKDDCIERTLNNYRKPLWIQIHCEVNGIKMCPQTKCESADPGFTIRRGTVRSNNFNNSQTEIITEFFTIPPSQTTNKICVTIDAKDAKDDLSMTHRGTVAVDQKITDRKVAALQCLKSISQ